MKHIGVYRFSTDQLQYLLRRCRVIPAMLQAEFHPYLYRKRLVQICKTNSIRMQAFCFIKVSFLLGYYKLSKLINILFYVQCSQFRYYKIWTGKFLSIFLLVFLLFYGITHNINKISIMLTHFAIIVERV